MLCNDNDVAYLKALLLSEFNTQEYNYTTALSDTIRAVFFIVARISCHGTKASQDMALFASGSTAASIPSQNTERA